MTIVLIVLGVIVVLFIAFIIWRRYATDVAYVKTRAALLAQVTPVVTALQQGQPPDPEQVEALARNAETRVTLYTALKEIQRQDLFPAAYTSLEQIAESHLVTWLLHPNELGAVPDEITCVKRIERVEADLSPETLTFFVFKYRALPPHWAADKGWMAGIAGPYFANDDPWEPPFCVFSRFEAFDSATPEEHLARTEALLLEVMKR
jgi:hypothetical protein